MRFRDSLLAAVLAPVFAVATASSLTAQPAGEEGQPATPVRAVVELYTSQGCSSCPPADALLDKLAADPSIIALTFPVDYWNYLGWKDTFGSPRNSERQRNYARARGDGAIYTPQAIVNGEVHVNGASEAEIQSAIERTSDKVGPRHIPIRFWQERNTLNFALGGSAERKPGTGRAKRRSGLASYSRPARSTSRTARTRASSLRTRTSCVS